MCIYRGILKLTRRIFIGGVVAAMPCGLWWIIVSLKLEKLNSPSIGLGIDDEALHE